MAETKEQKKDNVTKADLQEFVLTFDDKIVNPLLEAGFERNKYNVFDILNISRQELRHSDFLAFLMNPNQSGDVAHQFLRNFLALLSDSRKYPKLNLDFFKMFYGSFEKVIIRREYKNIDILVEVEVLNGKYNDSFVIVIENKVDSDERTDEYDDDGNEVEGQLKRYKKTIDTEYKKHHPIFLFLSPDKRQPSQSDWTEIGYDLIYSVLCRLNMDTADPTVRTLINDYKKMIRSEFEMENETEKLREAALKVYTDPANRDIFDFIFKCRPNRVKVTAEIIREYIGKDVKDWIEFDTTKAPNVYIPFTTKKLKTFDETLKKHDLNIYFQINVKEMKVEFRIDGSDEHREKLEINKKKTQSSQYLLDKNNNNNINAEEIERHEKALLDKGGQEVLKENIQSMLKELFAKNENVSEESKIYGFIYRNSEEICNKLKEG